MLQRRTNLEPHVRRQEGDVCRSSGALGFGYRRRNRTHHSLVLSLQYKESTSRADEQRPRRRAERRQSTFLRSEERRVGKECRSRRWPAPQKKKKEKEESIEQSEAKRSNNRNVSR